MTAGIYRIKNRRDEMIYIGCSVDIRNRWNRHRTSLRTRRHTNERLQAAWDTYGEPSFWIEIIETMEWPLPVELVAAERRHIQKVKPSLLYNRLPDERRHTGEGGGDDERAVHCAPP